MAFKMKGPGLPGFRKPAGSGFYKTKGYDINTSNSSPMKQGDEKGGYEEQLESLNAQSREDFASLPEEQQTKVKWNEIVTKNEQTVEDNKIKTITSTLQTGIIEGETPTSFVKPGDPGYPAWKKAHDAGAGKQFEDQFVYRKTREVNVDEKPKLKDTEWTNFKLGYGRVGSGQSGLKEDVNDGSFRYQIRQENGNKFGELSADDINNLVKDGKFKYEVKDGKSTGNILMSKNYYENTHQPMMAMKKEGEANRVTWQEERDQVMADFAKQAKKGANIRELQATRPDIWNEKVVTKRDGTEIKSYSNYGENPPWMKGDPNYGGMEYGVYNDDEVLAGTGKPNSLGTGVNFYGQSENVQGSRPNDYTKDAETGKYVLKEGAKTLDRKAWGELDLDEKKETLVNSKTNGKASKTGEKGAEKSTEATPSNIANTEVREGTMSSEEDFDDGSDTSVRL